MKKKTIGFTILCVLLVITIIYSIVITQKYQSLQSVQNTTSSDAELQSKINALTDELITAKTELQAVNKNNEKEVIAAAEKFLIAYYDNNNHSKIEQLAKIKSYVSDEVFASLQPTIVDGENEDYIQGLTYKSWMSDVKSYYRSINNSTAEVFIYCTLNVETDDTFSASPFIFSAELQYKNKIWILTEINQRSIVRVNY